MSENICPQCGAPNAPEAKECSYCGVAIKQPVSPQQPRTYSTYQQPAYQQPAYQQPSYYNICNAWPIKSKIVAAILAIFLGGLGIHKFYLGKTGMGIVYLLFSWTFIPSIVGFIEGIIYLCSNDYNFQIKNKVRLQ